MRLVTNYLKTLGGTTIAAAPRRESLDCSTVMNNYDEGVQIDAALERLAGHVSEHWRRELAALRAALDQQISLIETRLDESDHKPVIRATSKNISDAAAERADRARQQADATAAQALAAIKAELHARLDSEIAVNATLRTSLDDAKQQIESVLGAAATAEAVRVMMEEQHREVLKENQRLKAALDAAQAQLLDVQARLKSVQHDAESDSVGLAAAQQQVQGLAAELAKMQQRLSDVTTAKVSVEGRYQGLASASQKVTDALSQMLRDREQVFAMAAAVSTRSESAHGKETSRIAPLKTAPSTSTSSTNPAPASVAASVSASKKPLQVSEPARAAKRVKIRRGIQVSVDGIPGELVDVSIGGAQALLTQAVKPNQIIQLTIPGADEGQVTCRGRIVWAVYEQPATSLSVYRTGVKFTEVDTMAVDKFMNDFGERPTLVQSRRPPGVA
jgi:hypothetical protein